MFKLYGENEKTASSYCDSILKIEKYLAEASRSSVELRDEIKNYNRFSIQQIKKRFDAIDLLGIYSYLGGKSISFMVVGQPEFLDKVNVIKDKFTVDDVKAYLKWQIINHSASLLHSKAENEHFDFFGRKLMGKKVQQKVGDFFFSFMDTKAIEKKGFSPIVPLMQKVDSIKDFKDVGVVAARRHKEV